MKALYSNEPLRISKVAKCITALVLSSALSVASSVVYADDAAVTVDPAHAPNIEDGSGVSHTSAPHQSVQSKLTVEDELKFRVYGEFGIGGYMATNGEYAGKYESGPYAEGGIEFNYGKWYGLLYIEGSPVQVDDGEGWVPGHGYGGFEAGANRLYVGYKFDNGTRFEAGLFNDSSLDDVQFWHDPTPDFGYAVPNTRQLVFPLKLENLTGDLKWSISGSLEGEFDESNDFIHTGKYDGSADKFTYGAALVNGYVIYDFNDRVSVLLGSEITDGTGELYTAAINAWNLSARVWHHTGRAAKNSFGDFGKETGYYLGAKYEPFKDFWLSIGFTSYKRDFDEMQSSSQFGDYDSTTTTYVNGGIWWENPSILFDGKSMATAVDVKVYTGNNKNVDYDNKIYLMQIFYF